MADATPPKAFVLLFYFVLIVAGLYGTIELQNIFLKILCGMVLVYGLFCFVVTVDWRPRRRP